MRTDSMCPDHLATTTLTSLLDNLQSLLAPDATAQQALCRQMRQQVTDNRPALLLYGNYNAGKSSLINLLLGQDQAAVADIPQTSALHAYDWQNICLLDSPGINAPIDHQQITQAELDKVDLILFVIRSGDVDEAAQYADMARLLAANKRLCIVLNCDSADPCAVQVWQAQLNRHLLHCLPAAGISEAQIRAIPVLPANLLTAHKALHQGQPALLAASGFDLLASHLAQWATEQWQAAHWLPSLFTRLDQQLLQPLLQAAGGTTIDPQLALQQQALDHSEQLWQTRASAQLTHELHQLPSRLQQAMQLSPDECHPAIMQEIDALAKRLQAWVASHQEGLPEIPLHAWSEWQQQANDPVAGNSRLEELMGQCQQQLTADRIQTLLQQGQRMGLPWLKTQSAEALSQWAVRLNTALRLLTAGWEYYAAGRDEQRAQAQAREQALQQHQQIGAIIEHLRTQLADQLAQVRELLFAPQRAALQQAISRQQAGTAQQRQRQQQLHQLRQQFVQWCCR